jgi:hypothetical protein
MSINKTYRTWIPMGFQMQCRADEHTVAHSSNELDDRALLQRYVLAGDHRALFELDHAAALPSCMSSMPSYILSRE